MLHPGLYEQVINTKLQSELAQIPQLVVILRPLTRRKPLVCSRNILPTLFKRDWTTCWITAATLPRRWN